MKAMKVIKGMKLLDSQYRVLYYYCFFSTLWIVLTDIAVAKGNLQDAIQQSAKGLLFISITTALLYALIEKNSGSRQRIQQERDEAVKTYRELFEQHGLPQLLIDPSTGQIMEVNEAAATYYGWTKNQLCAMEISKINVMSKGEVLEEMTKAQLQKRNYFRFQHRRAMGDIRDVDVYSHPVRLHRQNLLYSIVVDVSEQRKVQQALERSNRLLKSFVSSGRAMMQYHDKQGVADAVTRSLVEEGGYAMAWIGLVCDRPSQPIQLLSRWGDTQNYVGKVTITWDDSATGNGPTGRAIKLGRPQWSNHIQIDQQYQCWQQAASSSQFRSSVTLPLVQSGRVFAVLNLYSHEVNAFDAEEREYLEALASDLSRALTTIDSLREYERVDTERLAAISRSQEALFEAVTVLSDTLELRDPYTAGHQRRVTWLGMEIGKELGLSEPQLEALNIACLLHDIGKISAPAEILSKPGRLSAVEFELIKQHPKVGEELLKKVSFDAPIAKIIGQHHERLDGSGYPRGLKGDEILLEARIITVADVMEAMISHRPYRPGLSLEKAIAELESGMDTRYDRAVVQACIKIMHQGGYQFLGVAGDPKPVSKFIGFGTEKNS